MADTITVKTTWSSMLPALLLLVTDGDPAGQKLARDELARMAKAADTAAEAFDQFETTASR